jgi:hypothetical protein
MKVSWRSGLWAAALVVVCAMGARADEIRLAPDFEPFQSEAQTNAAPASHIEFVDGQCTDQVCGCTPQCCGPSRHVGRDFFVCGNRCSGLIGGIDLLLIKPYASGGLLSSNAAQINFTGAYRAWVGRQNADGLGARIRYFEFNQGAGGPGAGGPETIGVQFRYLDAELTQVVDFRRWSLLLSGGLRYGETSINRDPAGIAGVQQAGFDGVGLTFGAQASRDLNSSGSLRMVSAARWSALYGNSKGQIAGAIAAVNDDLVNVFELNIGPQYRRRLRNGAYLTLGGGIEAQYWSNAIDAANAAFGPLSSDAGFVGFSSTVAITR